MALTIGMTVPVVLGEAAVLPWTASITVPVYVQRYNAAHEKMGDARPANDGECEIKLFKNGSQVPRQPILTKGGKVVMGDPSWTGMEEQTGNTWSLEDKAYKLYVLHRTYGGEVLYPFNIANGKFQASTEPSGITKWGSAAPATFQQVAGARKRFGARRFRGQGG